MRDRARGDRIDETEFLDELDFLGTGPG